jgi:nitric oxide reductase NorE protein
VDQRHLLGDAPGDPAADADRRSLISMNGETQGAGKRRAGHVPGEEGVWVLIMGDMLVFSIFFATYLIYRAQNVALYTSSQLSMQRGFGLLNTGLLLTSSWFVALAVADARAGRRARATRLLLGALACGLGFVVSKAFEWGGKIRLGITLNSNEFYIFYYMLTGIHLLHVLIGLAVLSYLLARSRRPDPGASYVAVMEGGGAFWHLVDLLWIVLFALLYLVR